MVEFSDISQEFLKRRLDCLLKYIFKHKIVNNDVKLCHQIEVFTPEYLSANNKLHGAFLSSQFTVVTIAKLKQINKKSFYRLLTILSGDISLNPGPVWKHERWNGIFSKQKVCI